MVRALAALAGAAALLAASPAGAMAHAVLEESVPERGAALDRAPDEVALTFDEPIESSFGALRVFDRAGERVDGGEVMRPDGNVIAVDLDGGLPAGPYTVTYRVISADSHPVGGGYVFTVGESSGTPAAAVADLLDAGDAGPVTEAALGIARGVSYAAIALVAGGLLFWLAAWRPVAGRASRGARAAFARRARAIVCWAAIGGLAAAIAGIALQGATAAGTSLWGALEPDTVRAVLDTRFGWVWAARAAVFASIATVLLASRSGPPESADEPPVARSLAAGAPPPAGGARGAPPVADGVLGAGVAYLLVSPALAGHAGAGDDAPLLIPADVLHVAAMSTWVGGVALLVLAVPAATRALEPAARTRLLAALVPRFSTIAIAAVATLLATGIVQSVVHLDALDDLVDTAFGRAVAIKIVLFAALVGLGAHNRLRSQPALRRRARAGEQSGSTGLALRRAIRAELALMAVALGVTAALVSYAPSADTAGGPFSTSADIGPARIEMTVDPAAIGRNEIHLYLFDRATGARYDRPRTVGMTAIERERGIGPIEIPLRKAGPGHYVAPHAQLVPAGDWALTVRALISDFEELRTEIEVPVE